MALVSDISARQLDKFSESIQTTLTNISNGQHIVSGGQVELISPSSFNLIFNGVNKAVRDQFLMMVSLTSRMMRKLTQQLSAFILVL